MFCSTKLLLVKCTLPWSTILISSISIESSGTNPRHINNRTIDSYMRVFTVLNVSGNDVNGNDVFKKTYTFLIGKSLKENEAQMAKIVRKCQENHEAQAPNSSVFIGYKSILRHYYIQNVQLILASLFQQRLRKF